jgi:hypothetical protein
LDLELNAWVGMSVSEEDYGHVCACDVVSADPDAGDGQPPARKLTMVLVLPAEFATTYD